MKLWLSDFQRMGATFTSMRVDEKVKRHIEMYGRILFPSGEYFYVKVRVHRGAHPFIVKVCSMENSRDAFQNTQRLLKLRAMALEKNTNDICTMVQHRDTNTFLWKVMMFLYLTLTVWFGWYIFHNLSFVSVMFFIAALGGLVAMYKMRYRFICKGFYNVEV